LATAGATGAEASVVSLVSGFSASSRAKKPASRVSLQAKIQTQLTNQ
jgi:hypothetical protein